MSTPRNPNDTKVSVNPKTKKVVKDTPIVTKSQSGMGKTCSFNNPNSCGENWQKGSSFKEPVGYDKQNLNASGNDNKTWVKNNNNFAQGFNAPSGRGVKDPFRAEFASEQIILDDPSMIQDVLTTQKTLIKGYGIAICEGSTQKFRHILNKHLEELAEDQFDSFQYMQSKNLYPTEPAPEQKLTQAKERFKTKEETMNATRPRR